MLSFQQQYRERDFELAHQDRHVQDVARLLARLTNQDLLGEAMLEMIKSPGASQPTTREWRGRVQRFARTPEEEATGYELLAACYAVATKADPPGPALRRGAVLEQLVFELLVLRPMDPVRMEVKFVLPAWTSARQDVVGVDPRPIEVHECKSDPYDLVQGVFDGMAEVREQCDWHGLDVTLAISTLQTTRALADAIEDLELSIPGEFFQCTYESILGLKTRRPWQKL